MLTAHPDRWDPDCQRCRTSRARHPILLHGHDHRPYQPNLDDALLGHWNDPAIPASQLDRWDAICSRAYARGCPCGRCDTAT